MNMKKLMTLMLALLMALSCVSFAGAEDALDPVTLTMFVDLSWLQEYAPLFADSDVGKYMTEKTGVTLDMTVVTDSTQLAVMVAGGDLPDLVFDYSHDSILCDPEVCYSYNELVELYGVDLNASEDAIKLNTASDGNYYALKTYAYTDEDLHSNDVAMPGIGTVSLIYRDDLYQNLGSPAITTLDELYDVLVKAKEAYPDMVTLLWRGGANGYLQDYFKAQYGITNYWLDEANQPHYYLSDPAMKEYYAFLNRLAMAGIINPETFTYDDAKFNELYSSGQCFMAAFSAGGAEEELGDLTKAGLDTHYNVLANDLTDVAEYQELAGGFAGTYVTKNCKDPERAAKWLEWVRSDEGRWVMMFGIEGVHYELDDTGFPVRTEYMNTTDILKTQCAMFDFGTITEGLINAADPSYPQRLARLQTVKPKYHIETALKCCDPVDGDELTLKTKLDTMVNTEQLKCIFAESEEEFNAAYDEMMKKAESIGLSNFEGWMAEQYSAQ